MGLYLVRLKENKELVGLFGCHLDELQAVVDESSDPFLCEYITVTRGGIFWAAPGAVTVGADCMEDETPLSDGEPRFTGELWEAVWRKKWKPLP